ncbi:MAG: 3-oxoacyl-[acyl-carrier protein] reductase [Psychromonas sp.]|jgi:3-oxoacyl-[acyl-carrier protein] reductase|uniref:SDR family oxidoreductase n=1 Tax=Psychromonas sp. TaxID=1884585 RepID=UPI0039E23F14
MNLNLKNKKALVMGASAGIGKAIAESLINEGAEVYICSRSEQKLRDCQEEIGAAGYEVCDLSKPLASKELIERVIARIGQIDILVTNTGGPEKANFLDVSDEQWHLDFQSIWMSPVESIKAVLPHMKENNYGRVIMVTSVAAKEPISGLTTSNGLRAGLSGLAKSIANEFSAFGITINLLLPGYTNTDRLKSLKLSEEQIKAMVPAGRLGEPSELADLATFLASEKGSYITGQSIAVDGGVLKGH